MLRYLGKRVVLVREPEDVAHVLTRRPDVFGKHPRLQRISAWLGEGVATQPDPAAHAAQREVLNPAFRPDYVRQMDALLAAAAARLADAVQRKAVHTAAAPAPGPPRAPPQRPPQPASPPVPPPAQPVEVQELFKRHALDVLGLANMRADFGALAQGGAGTTPTSARAASPPGVTGSSPAAAAPDASASSSPAAAASAAAASTEGLVELLVQIEAAAGWLLLQLPLPDRLLPGYDSYVAGTARLDGLVYDMIRRRRQGGVADEDRDLLAYLLRAQRQQQAQQVQQVQQVQQAQQTRHEAPRGAAAIEAGPQGCPHAAAAAVAGPSAASGCDFTGPATAAERGGAGGGVGSNSEGGCGGGAAITDKQIRDELVTMLFAGTDTSAHTLALTCHHLAAAPEAQRAARAEVLAVLAGRAVGQLTADDVRRMPFLAAALNETMRLYPGGPKVARLAKQDEAVGGVLVPGGCTLVVSLYSMHRHPAIWPAPDEWLPQRWMPEGWAGAYWPAERGAGALAPRQANAFLPFGVGPRGCIGRNFALLNMQMTLAALLSRLELLPDPRAAPLELVHSSSLRAKRGVHLLVRPL